MKLFIGRIRVQACFKDFTRYYVMYESFLYPDSFVFKKSYSSLAAARRFCERLNDSFEYEYIGKIHEDAYGRLFRG